MSKLQEEVMSRRSDYEERADPEMRKIDLSSDSCRPELQEEFWKTKEDLELQDWICELDLNEDRHYVMTWMRQHTKTCRDLLYVSSLHCS